MGVAPVVSIVMPVYNGEKYLNAAIDSILGQTYRDFEFLIINDCSSDATEKIIRGYSDARIRVISNDENKGIAVSLNTGFAAAKGKYIARMDADDIACPQRIKKQVDFLQAHPEVGVCAGNIQYIGASQEQRMFSQSSGRIAVDLLFNCAVCHPTVMIRKEILQNDHLEYDGRYEKAEDYKLWCQAVLVTEIAAVKEIVLFYRLHPGQVTNRCAGVQKKVTDIVRMEYLESLGVVLSAGETEVWNSICNQEYISANRLLVYDGIVTKICRALKGNPKIEYRYLVSCLNQMMSRQLQLCKREGKAFAYKKIRFKTMYRRVKIYAANRLQNIGHRDHL